jgi:hypothetical protein
MKWLNKTSLGCSLVYVHLPSSAFSEDSVQLLLYNSSSDLCAVSYNLSTIYALSRAQVDTFIHTPGTQPIRSASSSNLSTLNRGSACEKYSNNLLLSTALSNLLASAAPSPSHPP